MENVSQLHLSYSAVECELELLFSQLWCFIQQHLSFEYSTVLQQNYWL